MANETAIGPAIGPGATEVASANVLPLLWGATDTDVIQVFNPLLVDFHGRVGQSPSVNEPFNVAKTIGLEAATNSENDAKMNYGLNLKNPDHTNNSSFARITTVVKLPAGQTINLLGGVAKVVVTQLVNEIMQRQGNALKMADPSARNAVEREVVKGYRNIQDVMQTNLQTEQQQIDATIANLNRGETYESKFDSKANEKDNQPAGGVGQPSTDSQRRGPGRPPKS